MVISKCKALPTYNMPVILPALGKEYQSSQELTHSKQNVLRHRLISIGVVPQRQLRNNLLKANAKKVAHPVKVSTTQDIKHKLPTTIRLNCSYYNCLETACNLPQKYFL